MPTEVQLIACKAIANGALKKGELPTRLKILDWGDNQVCDGTTVRLDDQSIAPFEATQKKSGRTRVPLDYNHSTVPDTKAHEEFGDRPNIFAYGTPRIIAGDGMWLEDIKWTPFGEQYAKNCEDISPAPLLKSGRVIGLDSCALTPTGAIEGLSFYSAKPLQGVVLAKYSSVAAYAAAHPEPDEDDFGGPSDHDEDDEDCMCATCTAEKLMQFKARQIAKLKTKAMAAPKLTGAKVVSVKEPPAFVGQPQSTKDLSMEIKAHIAKYRADLGLPETMSDEDVMDRVRAKFDESVKPKQPLLSDHQPGESAASLEKGNIPTDQKNPHATITYSADDIQKLVKSAVADALAAKAPTDTEQKQALIAQATKDGKVTAFMAPEDIAAIPLAQFKKLVEALPAGQVPMEAKVRAFSTDANKNDRSVAVSATKSAWTKAVGA